MQLRHQHVAFAQPDADAFDELVQRLAARVVLRQQAAAGAGPGHRFQRTQPQVVGRGGEPGAVQVFTEQAAQMGDVLGRLGRADLEPLVARQRHAVEAAQVERPFELQCEHSQVPRLQPHLQLRQQPLRRPHQFGRVGGQRRQFQPEIELLRQLQPGMGFRSLSIRRIERLHERGAEAALEAGPRQPARVTPGAAADPLQHRQMVAGGGQHVQRQVVRLRPPRWPVRALQAQQREGLQRRRPLRPPGGGQGLRIGEQTLQEPPAPAPQPQGRRRLEDQRFVRDRDPRRELQRPPAPAAALALMGWQQCDPVHAIVPPRKREALPGNRRAGCAWPAAGPPAAAKWPAGAAAAARAGPCA